LVTRYSGEFSTSVAAIVAGQKQHVVINQKKKTNKGHSGTFRFDLAEVRGKGIEANILYLLY
jgi:hypothetical protein